MKFFLDNTSCCLLFCSLQKHFWNASLAGRQLGGCWARHRSQNYLCHTPAYTRTLLLTTQGITLISILTLLLCPPSITLSLASLSRTGRGQLELPVFLARSRSLGELPPSTCGAGSALTPLPLLLLLLPVAPAGAGGGRSPGSESTPGFALQCTHSSSTSTCTPPRHHRPTLLLFCNFHKILLY